ncbi:MAG: hypothetical protein ABIS86_21855 [Streptosporangiaceae bacterium]
MMDWNDGGMSGWGYALMTLSMVMFWSLVVFAVISLVRSGNRTGQQHHHHDTAPPSPPEQLLAERFARGEIEADDYGQRLAVLRGGHQEGESSTAVNS